MRQGAVLDKLRFQKCSLSSTRNIFLTKNISRRTKKLHFLRSNGQKVQTLSGQKVKF